MFLYGELNPESNGVKLATPIPWDAVEKRYATRYNGPLVKTIFKKNNVNIWSYRLDIAEV